MTRTQLIILAALGSFALLGGAFIFQAIGYAPCKMCLWQRWPHAAAIILGLLAVLIGRFQTTFAALGALATFTTGAIGLYHTGVERAWWDGPLSCTGLGVLNFDDPLNRDVASVVMCDDVVWNLMSLSMASYNFLISLVLVGIWIAAARKA